MRILFLLLCAASISVTAQNDFYYLTDGSQIPLTEIENVYFVHFKSGVGQQGLLVDGYQFAGDYYVVFDISQLSNHHNNYTTSKAYQSVGDTIYEGDEIVLAFKPSTTQSQKIDLIAQYNLILIDQNSIYERYESANATQDAASIFESDLVKFAHPNFFLKPKPTHTPNDLYFNKQFYLHNTGQVINDMQTGTVDADIDAVEAWDITKGDSNIIVAILDRGITSNHIDLPNTRQVRLPGGNLSASISGNNPNDLTPDGGFYHGDPCAGIVAATQDNAIGISGIAPESKIMPVKFEQGSTSTILADCIIFADTNNANILSGSLDAGFQIFPVIEAAIAAAQQNDLLMIFAAGNTRFHLPSAFIPNYTANLGYLVSPANSVHKAVIAVGASDRNDQIAIYSTINENLDIVAPSSKTNIDGEYSFTNTTFSLDVWSMDVPDSAGINPFTLGDSFIQSGETSPNSGLNHIDFTARFGGTSAATPMVASVAALVLSVNSCLSNLQVKDILLNTADKVGGYNYNWSSTKPGHSKQFGYGRVNAHKAVLAAQSMSSPNLDLLIKDVPNDFGDEPDTAAKTLYLSEDIWVRNQQDGLQNQFHQNPEYDPIIPVYVYVRVKNKSCVDATPNDSVTLHWAKASTALSWPHHWNGSITSPLLLGDSISTISVGNLKAGTDTILEFTWLVPNPLSYTVDPSHFCLLARVKSAIDTMTFPEGSTLWRNVRNNNNIAWKNVSVVNIHRVAHSANEVEHGIGSAVSFGNDGSDPKTINLLFKIPEELYGNAISLDAEITIKLDENAFEKWENGGYVMSGLEHEGEGVFRVLHPNASLENFDFDSFEQNNIFIGFNMLTEAMNEKTVYRYYVEEYSIDEEYIGGEEYFIHTDERPVFYANAGQSQNLRHGQSANLHAQTIDEPAIYNWYDESGKLFYSGIDTSFIPSDNQKFLLEIIALSDGYKDYDEKEISIKENYISSISPNPVSNSQNLSVTYTILNTLPSAQLVLTNNLNTTNTIYTITPTSSTKSIPINNYIPGSYTLRLIVNGIIVDAHPIVIN